MGYGYSSNDDVYAPCRCGSGKKYKFCCLKKDREERRKAVHDATTSHWISVTPLVRTLPFDLEEGEREFQLGLSLVGRGRGREAAGHFERSIRAMPLLPSPYNNLALARFIEGDVERAIEVSERVVREMDPDNVFALASLVHYYLFVGRESEAERAAGELRDSEADDEPAFYKRCEAFGRLGWHEEVLEAALDAVRNDMGVPGVWFYAGVASANLGRYEEARRYLSRVQDAPPHGKRSARYLKQLARRRGPESLDGDWPYLEPWQWAPESFLKRLQGAPEMGRYPGVVKGLVAILNDDPTRGDLVVEMLGQLESREAVETLRRIAFGTFGPDQLRMQAVQELDRRGEIVRDTVQQLWLKGQWSEVECSRQEITPEAASAFPGECQDEMEKLIVANREQRWKDAESIGRDLLARAPRYPNVYQNLAVALQNQGRVEEAEALLLRCMELDPTYLFAPSGLAMIRLRQGRVEEAHEILKATTVPARVHPDAYAVFVGASARTAVLRGDIDVLLCACESLETLTDCEVAEEQLRVLRPLVGLAGRFSMKSRRRKEDERLRRQLVSPDATLVDCLERYTRPRLDDIGACHGLGRSARGKKRNLVDSIAGRLEDPEHLRFSVELLPAEACRALAELAEAGGSVPYRELSRRYACVRNDEGGKRSRARTALEWLEGLGFAYEGTVGGCECIFIPGNLRDPLDRALAARRRASEGGSAASCSPGAGGEGGAPS